MQPRKAQLKALFVQNAKAGWFCAQGDWASSMVAPDSRIARVHDHTHNRID